MKDSILDYVLAQLTARRGQWQAIAKATGIPYKTIEKIGYGAVLDPQVRKVETLARFFRTRRSKKTLEARPVSEARA